ncbi:MAG TPA: SMP-30/gluconolactonase/LRE family protein [Candidatus Elarobacter sp.]|jgi:sugar lactone lactonase YvrE|nr:SMP-30/gluconolactonase/LRE family protein [Candidatus Elarobacter sp.]
MAVDVVLKPHALNGESPTWSRDEGVLYWCDTIGQKVHRFDPRTGEDESWSMPSTLGSFGLGTGDAMLIAMRTGVYRFDRRTARLDQLAAPPFDPHRFTWNDGKTDPRGRFWVGPMYAPLDRRGEGPKAAPLHRIAPSGEQLAKTAPVRISNGLAWSADARTMYHSDTAAHEIYAYDVLDADEGVLGERRTFAHADSPKGGPDGGATDTDGCYWSAVYGASKLVRFTPDGRVEREVALPVPNVTMIAFGGDDLRTAYVTTASNPLDEAQRAERPLWGALFAFEAPAPGVAIPLLDEAYFA